MVFVRGVCKSRIKIPCHKPGDETHQAKKLDVLCEDRTLIKHESEKQYLGLLSGAQVERKGRSHIGAAIPPAEVHQKPHFFPG